MGRCQDIFASEKSTLQAADAQGFESPTSSQVLSIQNCVFMEKMYSKQDVVRLVALERDRCINEVYGRIKEVERLGRTKPGLKVWTRRVVDALEKVLLKVVNGKMVKGVYEEQLEALVYRDYFGDMPVVEKVTLDGCVYPSEEKTIRVVYDETYGGAHCYIMRECLGFADGVTSYTGNEQVVQFIRNLDDGTVIPGIQSEQLALVLLDRHKKLNARFPSPQNEKMITGLEMFLEACKERVQGRMERGVMGKLEK